MTELKSHLKSELKSNMTYLKDYEVPNFIVDDIHLHFDLFEEKTIVKSILTIKRNPTSLHLDSPLVLDGEELELKGIKIDGKELTANEYKIEPDKLIIHHVPDQFLLETEVLIKPQENTHLSGLYQSGNNFCTQCESRGFRHITYYLDRPDVMSKFTTTISADKKRYPILLSNGNLIESRDLSHDRHWVHWEDPSLKPAYLFALVAGDFDLLTDEFTTMSGKPVALRLYLEKGYADQGGFALEALKRAMKWDEVRFGREYDLDIYMVVAVSDFTMGAMENKGLNIFNTKYILANAQTATDMDYVNVLRVVGHEYFHNWSGNRITCRDWFQITLKEGLTVFREQLFSIDETSPALVRIEEVNLIRNHQFLEDNGPNSHPIRPEAYIEVDNFYTTTVYHKGSEVIGMVYTLLGKENFRKAMDLYFTRYDGQAVTTEDFLQAMADSSGRDLNQFKRWYFQAGTPVLDIEGHYDQNAKTFELIVKQSCNGTTAQDKKLPFHLPLAVGLIDTKGHDMSLQLENENEVSAQKTKILEVKDTENRFKFINVNEEPTPSLLRNFSAPVKLNYPYAAENLAHLLKYDSDTVMRWDAGQQLMTRLILNSVDDIEQENSIVIPQLLLNAMEHLLTTPVDDYHLFSKLISLPSELYVGQQRQPSPVMPIHKVITSFKHHIALNLEQCLLSRYQDLHQPEQHYHFDIDMMGQRSFKNICLMYLVASNQPEYAKLAYQQFKNSNNMSDIIGALMALNDSPSAYRDQALSEFYERWQSERLLVNKWFALQAASSLDATPARVHELLKHPAFSLKNPNNVYALVVGFVNNLVHFHNPDGSGYQWLCEQVLTVDGYNPQVAARIIDPLTHWYRFDAQRQSLMLEQLKKIVAAKKISNNIYELAKNSLEYKR